MAKVNSLLIFSTAVGDNGQFVFNIVHYPLFSTTYFRAVIISNRHGSSI